MTISKEEFLFKIGTALSGCQLVEQALKSYLTAALDLARQTIGDKLPFKMNGEDYKNHSLGDLIRVFKKLSDDDKLIKDLERFTEKRNQLSHKSIAECLDPDGELDYGNISTYQEELNSIEPEARTLWRRIFEKSAILGFEDLSIGHSPQSRPPNP